MLIELKNQIKEKQKIESKIQELNKEIVKLQRESSILNQRVEEHTIDLNNLERKIFVINKERKLLELEEKLRKSKSKLKTNNYQLSLHQIELNRLNNQYNEVKDSEILYQEELNKQISLLNNVEYNKLLKENELYKNIILESEPLIDCLKKMDLYYTRGDNYTVHEKLYTLGNSTWIVGSPSVDVHNLKKEIEKFEDLLKQIDDKPLLKDIDTYLKYSADFFENVLSLVSIVRNDLYAMKVIDFKRDISNITNKIRNVYHNNLIKENELRIILEDMITKK